MRGSKKDGVASRIVCASVRADRAARDRGGECQTPTTTNLDILTFFPPSLSPRLPASARASSAVMDALKLSLDPHTLDAASGRRKVSYIDQEGALVYEEPYVPLPHSAV